MQFEISDRRRCLLPTILRRVAGTYPGMRRWQRREGHLRQGHRSGVGHAGAVHARAGRGPTRTLADRGHDRIGPRPDIRHTRRGAARRPSPSKRRRRRLDESLPPLSRRSTWRRSSLRRWGYFYTDDWVRSGFVASGRRIARTGISWRDRKARRSPTAADPGRTVRGGQVVLARPGPGLWVWSTWRR